MSPSAVPTSIDNASNSADVLHSGADSELGTSRVSSGRHIVFISYSHQDASWAQSLHRKLEIYRVPKQLIGKKNRSGNPIPKRLGKCFLDRTDLDASPSLSDKIQRALESSDNIVVLCSPAAVASPYVDEEIKLFLRLKGGANIYAFIVAGEPNAAAKNPMEQECFPSPLRFELNGDGTLTTQLRPAPLAADARRQGDGKYRAFLKLVAALIDVDFDRLYQRERRRRRARQIVVSILAGGLLLATGIGTRQYYIEESANLASQARTALGGGRQEESLRLSLRALPAHSLSVRRSRKTQPMLSMKYCKPFQWRG